MRRVILGVYLGALLATVLSPQADAQKAFTWDEVKAKFEANNPALRAGAIGVDESKANEVTAYLRPNPSVYVSTDGTQIAPYHDVWQPLKGTQEQIGGGYLHERRHKRELRLLSAKGATDIAISGEADLDRTLVFSLRSAFVGTLQAKAVLDLVSKNLIYWDQVLKVSSDRFQAGDIAQLDLQRLELQRAQFESDVQTAEVNLRTSKIALLTLLNDRTPIDQFDVLGSYDFTEQLAPLTDFRQTALDNRPDLKEAVQAVDKAKVDHQLAVSNGSTDPTFSAWYTHNPSFNNPFAHDTLGGSISIPLRVFDRNQGEKLRTQLDIDRNQQLLDATQAQVFSDVDSAYAMVNSNVILLRMYKGKYLDESTQVRDTVRFSYEHGGSALLDFLSAENDYRSVQLSYVNLVGSYLLAAAQLNMAIGREVIQ
jgi:cobalt-zinc-cadmium efflux system outer membrane protein